jgi:hypothetical protein
MKVTKTKTKIWKAEEFLVLGLKVKHVIIAPIKSTVILKSLDIDMPPSNFIVAAPLFRSFIHVENIAISFLCHTTLESTHG